MISSSSDALGAREHEKSQGHGPHAIEGFDRHFHDGDGAPRAWLA